MRFIFTQSHAFPGSVVSVDDDGQPGPGCLVEFTDGRVVIANHERDADDVVLRVPRYRTAKGHEVDSRTWGVAKGADGTFCCLQASL